MQDLNSIGERLKKLRSDKGLSQQQVANFLKIKRQTYSSYENNVSSPSIEVLRVLAPYLGASSDFIIGLSDGKHKSEIYNAQNIQNSNLVQGSGSVSVGEIDPTTKEETELLRIYRELDVRGRLKLMNSAFDAEDEYKSRGN